MSKKHNLKNDQLIKSVLKFIPGTGNEAEDQTTRNDILNQVDIVKTYRIQKLEHLKRIEELEEKARETEEKFVNMKMQYETVPQNERKLQNSIIRSFELVKNELSSLL